MRILTPAEINQPKGRRLLEDEQELGEELGLSSTAAVLNESRDWSAYADDFDIQRLTGNADPDDCTICSSQNMIYGLHKFKFGTDLTKKSRRFTALKSGNVRGFGNSFSAVDRSIVGDGMVNETDCPSGLPTITTLDQFYAPLDPSIQTKENFTGAFDYSSFRVSDTHSGLISSPVRAAVQARYAYNGEGEVINTVSVPYAHAVVILSEPSTGGNNFFTVQDSENPSGLVKFSALYQFQSLSACTLEKKNMILLFKHIGEPAIYFVNSADGLMVSYSDGVIAGGDMFKMLFGDYKFAPITRLNDADWAAALLAHPIAPYSMTTIFNQGTLSAIVPDDNL